MKLKHFLLALLFICVYEINRNLTAINPTQSSRKDTLNSQKISMVAFAP